MSHPTTNGAEPAADPIRCGVCGRPIFRGDFHRASFWWTPEGPPAVAHNRCLEPFDEIARPVYAELGEELR